MTYAIYCIECGNYVHDGQPCDPQALKVMAGPLGRGLRILAVMSNPLPPPEPKHDTK